MATFVLIHGGGGSAWDWHLVVPALHERGHDAVTVDLPREDPAAGWWTYVDTVVRAMCDRRRLVVVGHSLGAFTAPLVSARLPVELLVLLAGLIPSPGELFSEWWRNVGYESPGYDDVFYHDVPPELAAEAQRRESHEASRALNEPWPLDAWPDVPRGTSSAATIACSRRHGRAVTPASASGSRPTRSTAATTSR